MPLSPLPENAGILPRHESSSRLYRDGDHEIEAGMLIYVHYFRCRGNIPARTPSSRRGNGIGMCRITQ